MTGDMSVFLTATGDRAYSLNSTGDRAYSLNSTCDIGYFLTVTSDMRPPPSRALLLGLVSIILFYGKKLGREKEL